MVYTYMRNAIFLFSTQWTMIFMLSEYQTEYNEHVKQSLELQRILFWNLQYCKHGEKASLFLIFFQTEIHTMNTPIAEAHLFFLLAFVYLIAHSRQFNFYAWNFATPKLKSKWLQLWYIVSERWITVELLIVKSWKKFKHFPDDLKMIYPIVNAQISYVHSQWHHTLCFEQSSNDYKNSLLM